MWKFFISEYRYLTSNKKECTLKQGGHMDPNQVLAELESFRRNWDRVESKNASDRVISVTLDDGRVAFAMFFKSSFYQISILVFIGTRLGLKEGCTIVDTRIKDTEADRLITSYLDNLTDISPSFLELSEQVLQAKRAKNLAGLRNALVNCMEAELQTFLGSPEICEQRIRSAVRNHEKQAWTGGWSLDSTRGSLE